MNKVHKSAVVIIPPEDLLKQVQEIRRLHDKAYERWPPHINILYPFIPESDYNTNLPLIVNAVQTIKPFQLKFESFQSFCHGRSYTLYLEPKTTQTDALIQLQKNLFGAFPFCDDLTTRSPEGFSPHLTVGQFTGKIQIERQKKNFSSSFHPIEFIVTHIHLISRTDDTPFQIVQSIPLGCSGPGDAGQGQAQSAILNINNNETQDIKEPDDSSITITLEYPPQTLSSETDDTFSSSDPIHAAATRVENWIIQQSHRNKLPKTRNKLYVATKNLCISIVTPITGQIIFETLHQEGYIHVKAKSLTISYKKSQKKTSIQPSSSSIIQLGLNDSDMCNFVLDRCRRWVCEDCNSPKTQAALVACLGQLAELRVLLDQDSIYHILEKKGMLKFVGYDEVQYNKSYISRRNITTTYHL